MVPQCNWEANGLHQCSRSTAVVPLLASSRIRPAGCMGARQRGAVLAQRRAQQRVRAHLQQQRVGRDGRAGLHEAHAAHVALHLRPACTPFLSLASIRHTQLHGQLQYPGCVSDGSSMFAFPRQLLPLGVTCCLHALVTLLMVYSTLSRQLCRCCHRGGPPHMVLRPAQRSGGVLRVQRVACAQPCLGARLGRRQHRLQLCAAAFHITQCPVLQCDPPDRVRQPRDLPTESQPLGNVMLQACLRDSFAPLGRAPASVAGCRAVCTVWQPLLRTCLTQCRATCFICESSRSPRQRAARR